jgi:hypothetical protein
MKFVIASALILSLPSMVFAQSPQTTQYGDFSARYNSPGWGQSGLTAWGTYSGNLGQGGWNYNKQLQPNEPVGSVLLPNQLNSSFDNVRTGAGLFMPQDTRLKGRDRP